MIEVSLKISKQLHNNLSNFASKNNLSLQEALDMAIQMLFRKPGFSPLQFDDIVDGVFEEVVEERN